VNNRNEQQNVIVTAGGSGIGLAIARRFIDAGANVHICDISAGAIAAAIAENPQIRGTVADVSKSDQVAQVFDEALDWMSGLDVLVNNAGIGGPRTSIDETIDSEWEETIAVNLNGAFYCMKLATRIMKPQNSGAIINISTASVRTGLPFRASYVASKAGLEGLTYNAARELGPHNIRCNAILPGAIDNPRGKALMVKRAARLDITVEEAEANRLSYISMRTRVHPDEIGDTAVFLASNAARHISGQMIGVCGNSEWEE